MSERPQVGIGLMIVRENQIMLGRRIGSHGAGEYAGFGGHLEAGESFAECTLRELEEEGGTDLKIKDLRFLCVTNLLKYLPKHYVDIGMVAEWESGEAQVMEPDKVESWEWYDIDNLPSPLFGVITNYVEAYKTGKVEFSE